eukprot:Pgem_evm2s2022
MKIPSKFKGALYLSIIVTVVIYLSIAIVCYAVFGEHILTQPNIVNVLPNQWPMKLVSGMVLVHLFSAFLVLINPLFRQLESLFKIEEPVVAKSDCNQSHINVDCNDNINDKEKDDDDDHKANISKSTDIVNSNSLSFSPLSVTISTSSLSTSNVNNIDNSNDDDIHNFNASQTKKTTKSKRKWFTAYSKREYIGRFIIRTSLIALIYFIAIALPFYADLMSLIGGTLVTMDSFICPCWFYLALFWPKHWTSKLQSVFPFLNRTQSSSCLPDENNVSEDNNNNNNDDSLHQQVGHSVVETGSPKEEFIDVDLSTAVRIQIALEKEINNANIYGEISNVHNNDRQSYTNIDDMANKQNKYSIESTVDVCPEKLELRNPKVKLTLIEMIVVVNIICFSALVGVIGTIQATNACINNL